MKARIGALLLLAACLAAGPSSSGDLDEGGPQNRAEVSADPDPAGKAWPSWDRSYQILAGGGRLYAGTVQWVTVAKRTGGGPIGEPLTECGSFRFRVAKTVAGPQVRELSLPWWWQAEEDENHQFGPGTEMPIRGPWHGLRPPEAGQHLLLLLKGKKRIEGSQWDREHPVECVWQGVTADHPLVRGFQDAVEFLRTKDIKKQDELFQNLCGSPFPSHRAFARNAYSLDSTRDSQLVLQYLRFAVPLIKGRAERTNFVLYLTGWLKSQKGWPQGIPEPAVASFVEYCWQELTVRNDRNCYHQWLHWDMGLEGLEVLLHKRGTAWTLALLKKNGRTALEDRLRACTKAKDANLQKASKRVATLLELGFKPGWPQGIPEAALAVFAEFCWEELGAREPQGTLDSFRCLEALHWLERLLHQQGVARTMTLFQKHGRAALQERLRSIAQSAEAESQRSIRGSADVHKASKRVLALLGQR